MPRSIKPKMSKDELESFDYSITSIFFDDGEAVVEAQSLINDDRIYINFSEQDLEKMLNFIRRNKL